MTSISFSVLSSYHPVVLIALARLVRSAAVDGRSGGVGSCPSVRGDTLGHTGGLAPSHIRARLGMSVVKRVDYRREKRPRRSKP